MPVLVKYKLPQLIKYKTESRQFGKAIQLQHSTISVPCTVAKCYRTAPVSFNSHYVDKQVNCCRLPVNHGPVSYFINRRA